MVYGDRFFVSATVGADQLSIYAIPQEGLQRLLLIPSALCGALLPKLASIKPHDMAMTYHQNYRRVMLLMLGICTVVVLCAYPALAWWLSPTFATQAFPVVVVLSLGIWLNSIALVPYTFIHAHGNPKLTAIFHISELLLYLFALYFLTKQFGLVGAAVAWVARVLLDLILLQLTVKKQIRTYYAAT
jgi:O-antigen/teichoic acid export membrane protein